MSLVEEIQNRIDIVDFIGSYVSLKKTGKNYRGFCPFHKERHPSFFVSPDKGLWHCFSCQKGGDVIKFLMLYENISFQEAVKILAEKAGLDKFKFKSVDEKRVESLYLILSKAWQYFKENLRNNKEALNYFNKRGLKQETIEEFGLGYAPESGLVNYLLNLGFRMEDIMNAGLSVKVSGRYQDFFRERLIFPILNHFGKVVAFSGRVFKRESEVGKYINSPSTLIYNKSKILYGFYKSKSEINKTQTVILVEGYMDFLLSFQAGIRNIVAVSGTALTLDQIKTLNRFAEKIIFCFDNDEAGIFALERQIENVLNSNFEIYAVNLSPYKDPAEIAKESPSLLLEKFSNPKPVFEILFDFYLKTDENWSARKKNIIHLLQLIKKIHQPLEQSHWLKELAYKTGIDERTLNKQFSFINKSTGGYSSQEVILEKPRRQDLLCQELFSLAFYINDYLPKLKREIEIIPSHWKILLQPENNLSEEIKNKIAQLKLKGEYEFSSFNQEEIEKEFRDLISELRVDFLRDKSYKTREKLKTKISPTELEENLKEFQKVRQEIEKIKYEKEKGI